MIVIGLMVICLNYSEIITFFDIIDSKVMNQMETM